LVQLFGKDNPAYRGGITKLRTLIRNSKIYRDWKELIYQRDKYRCVDCGIIGTGKTLNAHHCNVDFGDILQAFKNKYSKYESPKDDKMLVMLASTYTPFWDMKNAVTLCAKCHHKRHELVGDVGK